MTKKIIYVDASSLKSDSLCDRRYLLHIIRGYTKGSRAANYKAGYGTSWHAFGEKYYALPAKDRSANMKELVNTGLESYKKYEPHVDLNNPYEFRTSQHLEKVMYAYHDRYQRGDSLVPLTYDIPKIPGNVFLPETERESTEKSLLEQKFCLPWYEDERIIIYLTGTIDMICDYHGKPIIVDHKTSATQFAKIPFFFEGFDMNIQTQFYVWIFRRLTGMDHYLPIMINGIFIKTWTKKAQEDNKFDGAQFQRSQLIEYTEEQMAQFEGWLMGKLEWVKRLALDYLDKPQDYAPTNYAACGAGFGERCLFYHLCKEAPHLQERVLNSLYSIEQYSPLNFND
jgi:hypothetical protein